MFTFTPGPNRTKRNTQLTEQMGQKEAQLVRRLVKCLSLLFLLVLFVPLTARAQVLYGSLVGTVTDPNGAAVANAKVEATNLATGAVTTSATDDRGNYAIHDLQVGPYKVSIAGASFKTTLKEGVQIEANKTYRFDSQLEVGGVAETVVVTSDQEAMLQTDRGDVNITQTSQQINNLPLFGSLGRNYQSLMMLIPGTARGT